MAILRPIYLSFPATVAGYDQYSSNVNAACAAGNTTISIPLAVACRCGLLRIKTEPGAFGVNAQVRILNIWGDDGAKNTVDLFGGEALVHAINQNIDFSHLWQADSWSLININVAVNVLTATTNFSTEVVGLI